MRCKNGTRKNKGDCVPYTSLPKPLIDSIIQEYRLKPGSATFIKSIKSTKRRTNYYTYNPDFTELENLDAKARARVAEILKYGTAKEKKLIL
jgi:hypothetical protein